MIRRPAVVAFWLSVIAVAASSMVTVVALSRHLATGELANVSTVLGISFVCAVLPVAVQSVAGARRAAAGTSTVLPWSALRPLLVAGAMISPIVATALGVPILAVALPVAQVVPALLVAVGRGELIALQRHRMLAANHLVEAAVRVVAGIALGWAFGAVGVALALLLAMGAALVTLRFPRAETLKDAAVPHALAALAALTVAIHLDVLLAPRLLGPTAADTYAVAALPAKGVFLALMAAGWLVIPTAAGRTGWKMLSQPVMRTFAAGLALSVALVVATPMVGTLFGKGRPEPLLAFALGVSMAAAAATWVGVQILITKDSTRLRWPPVIGLGLAVVVLVATWATPGSFGPTRLALAVLVGQGGALASTLRGLLRVARHTPFERPRRRSSQRHVIDLRSDVPDMADSPQPLGDPTSRRWLMAVSSVLVAACVLQQPGSIVHETKLDIALDPGRFLLRTFNLWEPSADFGHVQNQAVGYLFPMGPFYLIGHAVGLPIWLTQRLFMGVLLMAAFWGMVRLADWLGIGTNPTRIVGGLAYALSPYVVARLGNTSAMVTGAAFLPWILVLLVRASKLGSARRAGALAGLAVLLTGGVNAAVTVAVLAVPVIWLLTRTPGPRRRALFRWFIAGTALATLWWLLPLFFQQKYGFNFLPFTERASTTTAFTPLVEVVRGTADWLSNLNLGDAWIPAGWDLVSNPATILATGAIAALGLAGLARRDNPERTFLLLVFGAGVLAVGAGFGGALGNPGAPVVRGLLDGPAGMFRNVFKFTPLIAFATAMGITHIVSVAASFKRVSAYAPRVIAGAAAIVVLGALPMLQGRLVSPRGFDAVPTYWHDVAAYHDANAGDGRSVLLPGTAFGDYKWGRTEDDVLQALTDTPWGERSLIPLGSAGATRLLDRVDVAITKGGSAALPAALARAGISEVIVRNDLAWRAWNTPRPAQVRRAMDRSGLQRTASFGPTLGELGSIAAVPSDALDALVSAGERDLHAVEVYAVPGGSMVTSVAASAVAVVSGGPEAMVALEEQHLAAGAAVLAGDLPLAADRPSNVPLGQTWIQTDTLTRRDTQFGLSRDNTGAVLAADATGPAGAPVEQLLPYDPKMLTGAEARQTVAEWDGIKGVAASSSGSWLYGIPEAGPANLLDGDSSTPWVAGSPSTSVGEWVQIDLGRTLSLPSVDVDALADGPWRPRITSIRATTEAGTRVTDLPPGRSRNTVELPAGPTSWVRLTIGTVEGESITTARAGIGEVRLPGISAHRVLRLPDDRPTGTGTASTNPVTVMQRLSADPASLLRADEEGDIARRVTTQADGKVVASGTALPVPSDALDLYLFGQGTLTVKASSTLQHLPDHGVHNLLDNNPATAWISQPLPTDRAAAMALAGGTSSATAAGRNTTPVAARQPATDADPTVSFQWFGARPVDSLRITPVEGLPQPAEVSVVGADGTRRDVPVGADGWARFAPLTTDAITIHFPALLGLTPAAVAPLTTFGLADIDVPALRTLLPLPVADSTPIHIPCADGPSADIGGRSVSFSADTTVGQLRTLQPVTLSRCSSDPVPVRAGVNDITGHRGRAPLVLDTLVLTPTDLVPGAAARASARSAKRVASEWSADDRRIDLGGGDATVLVVAENFNAGWQATVGGQPLSPIRIDGWKQGFLVPAGPAASVELHYAPSGPYKLSLLLGALLALALAAFASLHDRGRKIPALGVSARVLPPKLVWALVIVATVWATGIVGLLAIPLALIVRRRSALASQWLASGLYLAAATLVAMFPGRMPADHSGAFSPFVQLLTALAVVGAFTTLLHSSPDAHETDDDDHDGHLVLADPEPATPKVLELVGADDGLRFA